MEKVYCVKEKKFTPNVPGSEKTETTKNGRTLLNVRCASCGKTKTRFIAAQKGGNVIEEYAKYAKAHEQPDPDERIIAEIARRGKPLPKTTDNMGSFSDGLSKFFGRTLKATPDVVKKVRSTGNPWLVDFGTAYRVTKDLIKPPKETPPKIKRERYETGPQFARRLKNQYLDYRFKGGRKSYTKWGVDKGLFHKATFP